MMVLFKGDRVLDLHQKVLAKIEGNVAQAWISWLYGM